MREYNRFGFFVISVLAALLLPQIFREGMFMDGSLYSAVAVNYSRGEGTFWAPHFSKVTMGFFHEQPPLMFGILGICFKIFGENLLTERFYAFIFFLIGLRVFLAIWKNIFSENQWLIRWNWMAVLIWVIIPNTTWVAIHNLEENTMLVFVLLSIFFQVKIFYQKKSNTFLLSSLAGISLFLAFLTKGFPGLFPLIFIPLHFIFFRENYRQKSIYLKSFFTLIFVLSTLIAFVFIIPPASIQLNAWLNDRVLNSVKHVSNTSHRFEIIFDLLMQLVPVFVLFPVLWALKLLKKLHSIQMDSQQKKHMLFFLLVAISGSFPLIITREQRGFYLATSHPFYAIFFALLLSPFFTTLQRENWTKFKLKLFHSVSILALFVSIFLMFYLRKIPKREPGKWNDINKVTSMLPYGSYLVYKGDMWNDWDLQTGLIRKKYITLTSDSTKSNYLLIVADQKTEVNKNYSEIRSDFQYYRLYKRKQ